MSELLEPVDEPFTPEVAEILASYPQSSGYILKLFRVFANSVRFLKKGTQNLLDKESPLPLRLREIVILRVTANMSCEYEWGVHVSIFSKHARLSDQQIFATYGAGSAAPCWSEEESLLIKVIDELCAQGTLRSATAVKFMSQWSAEEQLEILALCGTYHTISYVANVSRIEGEEFGARFRNYTGD